MSNLGSSLGTAIAGTILVSGLTDGAYALAMIALAVVGVVGLVAAILRPATEGTSTPGSGVRHVADRRDHLRSG